METFLLTYALQQAAFGKLIRSFRVAFRVTEDLKPHVLPLLSRTSTVLEKFHKRLLYDAVQRQRREGGKLALKVGKRIRTEHGAAALEAVVLPGWRCSASPSHETRVNEPEGTNKTINVQNILATLATTGEVERFVGSRAIVAQKRGEKGFKFE